MNDEWKSYPTAPAEGTLICPSASVPEGGSYSTDIDGFPLLIVRRDGKFFAYVNACPHQFLPLDYRSSSVLSSDGRMLRCTNHQAGFDLETGEGIDGFAVGCALDAVPVEVSDDGAIRIRG